VRTCAQYRAILLGLDRWLQRCELCTLVTADDRQLIRYLASWARGRKSLRRLSRVMLGLRRFYAYLCNSHVRNDNPMLSQVVDRWHHRQRPKTSAKVLQRESRQATTERDRAMLALMIATKLHVTQLIGLRMADLHMEDGYLSLRGQRTVHPVALSPALVAILRRFLLGFRPTLLKGRESAHVFPSIEGRTMTNQEFWRAFRREAAFAEEPEGSGRLGGWRSRRGSFDMSSGRGA
jgi:integrase/recombinase XerD